MKKIAVAIFALASLLLFVLLARSTALGLPPAPDFSINCTQDTLRTRPGSAPVRFLLSLVVNNGYQGTVHLACVTLNPHLTCEVTPPSLRLGADSEIPFVVTVWADPGTKPSAGYPLIVNAKGEPANPRSESPSSNQTVHLVVSGQ